MSVTTDLPFADRPQVFADDERLAGALLNRLTHHVHILEIVGDSYPCTPKEIKMYSDSILVLSGLDRFTSNFFKKSAYCAIFFLTSIW